VSFRSFRSVVAEGYVLLRYESMLRGNRTPTFRRNLSYLPSIVDKGFFHDLLAIGDEGSASLRNVGIQLPHEAG